MIKKLLLSLLELNSVKVVSKTGQKAPFSGLYRSEKEIIALTKGEKFPPFGNNFWKLIVSV